MQYIKKMIKAFFGWHNYISPLDQFLLEFDQTHPRLSLNQRQEKTKYNRIYKLRDKAAKPQASDNIWDQF